MRNGNALPPADFEVTERHPSLALVLLCGTGGHLRLRSRREWPNAPHLTRFSRYFSPADSNTPQRQEAQIVQSQLDL